MVPFVSNKAKTGDSSRCVAPWALHEQLCPIVFWQFPAQHMIPLHSQTLLCFLSLKSSLFWKQMQWAMCVASWAEFSMRHLLGPSCCIGLFMKLLIALWEHIVYDLSTYLLMCTWVISSLWILYTNIWTGSLLCDVRDWTKGSAIEYYHWTYLNPNYYF